MRLNIKRLNEDAILPTRATEGSAGYDIYAVEDTILEKGTVVKVHSGIAIEVESQNKEPIAIKLMIRSGLASKGIILANGVGLIDVDYRGEIIGLLLNICADDNYVIKKGERFAQLVIENI